MIIPAADEAVEEPPGSTLMQANHFRKAFAALAAALLCSLAGIAHATLILTFDNAGEGLKSVDGEALNWFEISDGSRKNNSGPYVYTKAVARVIGKNRIEVHSPEVAAPKHVRFSWHMFARNNLVNSEGLPAFPFRTDDYKNPRDR